MRIKHIPLVVKIIGFQVVFLVMHYLYDWFPGSVTYLFGTVSESIFQHMKVVFFTYILVTAVEYGLTRGSLPSLSRYIYSRLFCSVIMPLLMNVYYFTAAAYVGHLINILLEILFANIVLLALSTTIFILEGYFEQSEPSRPLKWIIVILFILTASEIVIFNYRLPWFDVFAIPPGWE